MNRPQPHNEGLWTLLGALMVLILVAAFWAQCADKPTYTVETIVDAYVFTNDQEWPWFEGPAARVTPTITNVEQGRKIRFSIEYYAATCPLSQILVNGEAIELPFAQPPGWIEDTWLAYPIWEFIPDEDTTLTFEFWECG